MDIKFLKMFLIIINKHWYYWCPHTDSNREPTDYKSIALPIEPRGLEELNMIFMLILQYNNLIF